MTELGQILDAAREDASVRVLIVTGAGEKAFIAGADIGELSRHTPVTGKEDTLLGPGDSAQIRDSWEAFDRRDQWIRAGRRMRTGDGLLNPNR